MAGWCDYFNIKDQLSQNQFDEQAMSIIDGVGHVFGGEGDLDYSLLFPRYEFKEPEKPTDTASKAATAAAISSALGIR